MKPTLSIFNEEAIRAYYDTDDLVDEVRDISHDFYNSVLYKAIYQSIESVIKSGMPMTTAYSCAIISVLINGIHIGRRLTEIEVLEKLNENPL